MLYLNFVLGTMEMHWMLASLIRKVFSPCDLWSQALKINKNSHLHHHQCYFGNKYLSHAYFSCIQPCVGCPPFGMKTLNVQLLWFWLISFTWYIFVVFVMKLQKPSYNWNYFFVILVAYLKAFPLSLVPLVICVMHLMCLKFIYIQ